jgi:integrase
MTASDDPLQPAADPPRFDLDRRVEAALQLRLGVTSSRLLDAWLKGYESDTSKATMRRAARAIARGLFRNSELDETSAPWILLAHPAAPEVLTEYRDRLLKAVRSLERGDQGEPGAPEKMTRATANLRLNALRAILRTAWKLGVFDREQLDRVLEAAESVTDRRALPTTQTARETDFERMAESSDDETNSGALDRAILALLCSGLRRAEATTARWEHLHQVAGALALRVHGKGGKQRDVYPPQDALDVLEEWKVRSGSPTEGAILRPVNKGDRIAADGPITPEGLAQRVKKRALKAGVTVRPMHAYRRHFVTEALRAGLDPLVVARLVGHADPRTTMAYDRRGAEEDAACARQLGRGRFRSGSAGQASA